MEAIMNAIVHLLIFGLSLTYSLENSLSKKTQIRIRVVAETPFDGAYLFDKEDAVLKSVSMKNGFEITETTDYAAAIFHSTTDEYITVEVYTANAKDDWSVVRGTGRILIVSTTGQEDGKKAYGVHVQR